MRVRIDESRCQGHTQCSFTAPMLFSLRDYDGHAEALVDVVPPEFEAAAEFAFASCPERAVVLED